MRIDDVVSADVVGRLGDALILMTTDGKILDANRAACDLYGYSAHEWVGMNLSRIRAPRFREHIPPVFRGANSMVRLFETEHVRNDGTHFSAEVRTLEVVHESGPVVLTVVRDISNRQDAEASLRISRARFDNIAATIPGVLYEYVPRGVGRGVFVFVGPGSDELLGIDEHLISTDEEAFWRLIHPDDLEAVLAEDEAVDGDDATFRIDFRIITPNGRLKWIYMASRKLPSQPGLPDVWCGLMLDITERKLAEEHMQQRDKEMARLNAELVRVASSDDLTGIASRRHFYSVLDCEVAAIAQHGYELAVVSFDLDGLKAVNDSRGHAAGDDVLAQFGAILSTTAKDDSVAGRLGGDEFSVILPGLDSECGAQFAQQVVNAVRSTRSLASVGVTVSAGVAHWQPGDRSDDLLKRADLALYASKRDGGDSSTSDPPAS